MKFTHTICKLPNRNFQLSDGVTLRGGERLDLARKARKRIMRLSFQRLTPLFPLVGVVGKVRNPGHAVGSFPREPIRKVPTVGSDKQFEILSFRSRRSIGRMSLSRLRLGARKRIPVGRARRQEQHHND